MNNFILFNSNTTATLVSDKNDWKGVTIALEALAKDIELVTGTAPKIENNISKISVIAGTIGKSDIIDNLAAKGKINISPIKDKWECYMINIVENPSDGTDIAMVITGSNKRGTIYGIYELSRMIGVSPWVWWGDSVPDRKSEITFPSNLSIVQGEPSVKYRGFFLNDEAPSLSGWMNKHFPKVANPQATQGCGSSFYVKVFELLLRLKGNYLWPVMWNNSFHTDDPQNTILADEYGVVMGTSHHEHMTCADKEWNWANLGDWNYATNREKIYQFWKDGVTARKERESIITLGMRGQADTSILGPNATLKDNMELMQKVLEDQREILKDVYGNPSEAPQMIALYKEVEAFYYGDEKAGKLEVPDDVTLMLCDDNFGHLRTLPTKEMLKRSGGYGMYYHFDYRGGPISYEWINQTPLHKIWDNMTTAYDVGIRDIWIVNVGDLKPMEFPLDYFMALAYDYETWSKPNKTHEFTLKWAEREFGKDAAEHATEAIAGHLKMLFARKAEVVHADTFSITKFDEAARVLKRFETIVEHAEKAYDIMPEHKKPTFYQMVLYPARASLNVYKTNIYAAYSLHHAEKGDSIANKYAQMARDAFKKDAEETDYYNTKLSNGKWDGIMCQNHMNYVSWDGPKIQVVAEEMPKVGEVPGGSNAGQMAEIKAIDYGNLPQVPPKTYIEHDGYVSINPSRFAKNIGHEKGNWTTIRYYGREFDSVKILPNTAEFNKNEPAPALEYNFHLQTAGEYVVNIFTTAVNNPYHFTVKPLTEQLRFSLQIDNSDIKTCSCMQEDYDVGNGEWSQRVMNNVSVMPIKFGKLESGLHALRLIAVDPGVVVQKIVIAPPTAKQTTISKRPPTQHFMDSYFGPPESYYFDVN